MKHNLGSVRELFGEHGVNIISVPQRGLYLDATEEQREELRNALQWLANHNPVSEGFRRDYIFQTVFRYQGNYTLQILAEELYVSRNLISKDIQYLNRFLEPFHVSITPKKNRGLVTLGHEFEIRQALIFYNNQKWWKKAYLEAPEELDPRISNRAWTFLSNFYPECAEEIWDIQSLLHKMEEEIKLTFTDVAFGRLMEYLIITRERIKLNKYITSYAQEERLLVDRRYLKAAEIFLANYIDEEHLAWKYERTYLAARMYVASTVQNRIRVSGYRDEVRQYLEEVRNAVGHYYHPPIDEELIDHVENLVATMQYRENYRISDWSGISKEVKKRQAGLYAVCMMRIYILEESTGLKFQEDDLAGIVLLIHNYMKKKRREAVLVTATNEETSLYHLMKLKEELPYLHFEKTVNYRDFKIEDYKEKLIISTIHLNIDDPNLICITKHVNESDIESIRGRLNEPDDTAQPVLKKMFREELVYNIVGKNKENVLKQVSQRMFEQGYVEEGFLKDVLEREQILTTSIGNRVAIPHVYKKHVRKSGVAVIRLKNSVAWSEEERVDLIFLFAIGEESSEDIKSVFSHTYNILKEENLLRRIRSAANESEIVQLILNCEYGAHHSNKK